MNLATRIRIFVDGVSQVRRSKLFNPWSEYDNMDLVVDAHLQRQERLVHHLSCDDVRIVGIGEAPGYQGCRRTGIAFTSERLLLGGSIPRIPSLQGVRLTQRDRPYSEPSATIVWKALYDLGLAESTILWNACPWHPMGVTPLSNRTPTTEELQLGLPYLKQLVSLYPNAKVVAVGKKAAASLRMLGVDVYAEVRHPAMGGATEFRKGLTNLTAGEDR